MKRGKTIVRIIFVLILIFLVLFLLDMGGFLRSPTLSAKESFQKALDALESQGRTAVLTKVSTGGITVTLNQNISPELETKGRGKPWRICFYSKEEEKFVYFVHKTGKRLEEEEEWAHHMCTGHKNEVNIEKWEIDSEEAVEVAKDKVKELEKKGFIVEAIYLSQEEDRPIWTIWFLYEHVGEETPALLITIDAETGEVTKIDETVKSFKEMFKEENN